MSGRVDTTSWICTCGARDVCAACMCCAFLRALGTARCLSTGLPVVGFVMVVGWPVLDAVAEEPAAANSEPREVALNDDVSVARVESPRTAAGNDPAALWNEATSFFRLVPPPADAKSEDVETNTQPSESAKRSLTSRGPAMALRVIPTPPERNDIETPERVTRTRVESTDCPWRNGSRFKGLDERSREGRCGFFHRDLTGPERLQMPRRIKALARLVHRLGTREVRYHLRSNLRDELEDDPSLDYGDYMRRKQEIGRWGREGLSNQDISAEAHLESSRNSVLGGDPVIEERDIPLVDWGPLRITDRGSVGVGMGRLARNQAASREVQLAPEEDAEPKGRSLFQKDTYSIDTDLKLRPSLSAVVSGEGYREALGKVAATIEIDFMNEILHKRYMTTEFELAIDTDNRASFFVNFVIFGSK